MADAPVDEHNDDDPLILPNPSGKIYAVELDKELDEIMETMDRKQKILATIICVPGEKTYVAADWMNATFSIILDADWMNTTFPIILDADPSASLKQPLD
jgi:hypothetical protein